MGIDGKSGEAAEHPIERSWLDGVLNPPLLPTASRYHLINTLFLFIFKSLQVINSITAVEHIRSERI